MNDYDLKRRVVVSIMDYEPSMGKVGCTLIDSGVSQHVDVQTTDSRVPLVLYLTSRGSKLAWRLPARW